MKCPDVRPQLTAYLDGELDADRGSAVRGHLRGCSACRDVAHHETGIVAGEGRLERQELVERRAERVDVGAVVHRRPLRERLLGTHVPVGAEDLAGHRQVAVAQRVREPEVGDPQLAEAVDEQVPRLDVAVDDAELVGVVERLRRLHAERDGHPHVAGFAVRAVGGDRRLRPPPGAAPHVADGRARL
jgi:hypothetical protein